MHEVTTLTDRFDRALLYATHVHGGQRRKGTSTPYIAHLLAVAATVLEYRWDEDLAIAGGPDDGPRSGRCRVGIMHRIVCSRGETRAVSSWLLARTLIPKRLSQGFARADLMHGRVRR